MSTSTESSCLCDNGAGSGGLVAPGGRQDTDGLVVAGQTVDTRLDENQAELGVLVLAVALEVLADGDSLGSRSVSMKMNTHKGDMETHLLDQHVQVLRDIGGKACKVTLSVYDHTEAKAIRGAYSAFSKPEGLLFQKEKSRRDLEMQGYSFWGRPRQKLARGGKSKDSRHSVRDSNSKAHLWHSIVRG